MAAFTSAVVSARTTSGCTITFNAAAIDCNSSQLKQLREMLNVLVLSSGGTEGDDTTPATLTMGALG